MRAGDGVASLVCPVCRSGLQREAEAGVRCRECGRRFKCRRGVPDLLSGSVRGIETNYVAPVQPRVTALKSFGADHVFGEIDRELQQLLGTLGRPLDIVDIGSGDLLRGSRGTGGRYFHVLKRAARSLIALEPSWTMIDQVNIRGGNIRDIPGATLVRAAGEELPVREESADAVLVLSVLDHCVAPETVLSRIHSVLRSHGILVIYLRNDAAWHRTLARYLVARRIAARKLAARLEDHHPFRFSPATLERLLCARGFDVVATSDFSYFLAPGLARAVNGFLWIASQLMGRERAGERLREVELLLSRTTPAAGATFLMCAQKSSGRGFPARVRAGS